MEIEDAGEIRTFETMPKEATLYMTAVLYSGCQWMNGPCGYSKDEVVGMLQSYAGVTRVRIYSVRLPISGHPA